MTNDLLVNIVSPSGSIFSGTASAVIAPGSIGEMTLLPKHAPLLSSLAQGKITIQNLCLKSIQGFWKYLTTN